MWILFRAMSSASIKIAATFVMVLVLIMVGILFFPQGFNAINDFANWIANLDFIRNPDVGEQGVAVTRVFINESSIFGIVMTLIARMVVEILFFSGQQLWKIANPPEEADPSTDGSSTSYYANS